jgi:uncharacterized protein (TIGR02118 family)
MTKVLIFLTKRKGMSRDDFRRYWRDVHGPLGAAMPGVRKYVQNHALADGTPFDGVAEMWFDSPEAMGAAFSSPEAAKAAADVPNLLDGTQMMVVDEVEMV